MARNEYKNDERTGIGSKTPDYQAPNIENNMRKVVKQALEERRPPNDWTLSQAAQTA